MGFLNNIYLLVRKIIVKPVLKIFSNTNIVNMIRAKELKSNSPVSVSLSSGSVMSVDYRYNDGIISAAKRLKMGFPLHIEKSESVIKTIERKNGVKIKMYQNLDGDKLSLRSIAEQYPEGIITKDYKDNKQVGGQVWVNGGGIILKYRGHLSHPSDIQDYTDNYLSDYFTDIVHYIKDSAKNK